MGQSYRYNAGMLTLLALLSARAEDPAPDLDALITISVTPIIQHPLIQVEPQTESQALRQVLRDNQGALIYCFERSLKSDPDLSGSLTVELTVEAGRIQAVTASEDTFTDAQIGQCVTAKMRGWRYPEALSGTFTLPFTCGVSPEAP
jgi:hypothetical protein